MIYWHRVALLAAALQAPFAVASSPAAVPEQHRWLSFAVFMAVIGITMLATYVAAKRVRTAADFYTAGGGVSGIQNGWAIAGDYLSAAS
ncbi:MAG: cation/acetate symporter, partial [Pseudomonadota bacterium]|nr:cation/acetate symporter [Pseudomonadota bacterium]